MCIKTGFNESLKQVTTYVATERPLYLHFDDIFECAAGNIAAMWRQLEQAICANDASSHPTYGDWNLDTGRDEHDRLEFWD